MANKARCPRCKQEVPGLVIEDGKLRVEKTDTVITSYWCGNCQHVIHYGAKVGKGEESKA